jgi:CRISP-associated protein Cas1
MIKRTLLIQQPCYLKFNLEQLVINYNKVKGQEDLPDRTVPLEDVGVIVIEHQQTTVTNYLLHKCAEHNIALVTCNDQHMPIGLLMSLDGHTTQTEKYRHQVAASEPLKKQLWQQIISRKIRNQAMVFAHFGINATTLNKYASDVKSGDTANAEGSAAAHYWQNLFPPSWHFYRRRDGKPPNNLLNYGYSIIRAITARAIVATGLLPTLGIFHRNRYNAYCLADDLMEPYRPFVDLVVRQIINETSNVDTLTNELKVKLLNVASHDVLIDGQTSPLLNAVQRSANSLAKCFAGELRKLNLPSF